MAKLKGVGLGLFEKRKVVCTLEFVVFLLSKTETENAKKIKVHFNQIELHFVFYDLMSKDI